MGVKQNPRGPSPPTFCLLPTGAKQTSLSGGLRAAVHLVAPEKWGDISADPYLIPSSPPCPSMLGILVSYMAFCCQVQDLIHILVSDYFPDDEEAVMRDPILFGDFRMALHEGEPRVYEDIQDYEAAKALFQVGRLGPGNHSGALDLESEL